MCVLRRVCPAACLCWTQPKTALSQITPSILAAFPDMLFGLMEPSLPPITSLLFSTKTRKALKQTGEDLSVGMLPVAALK